MGVVYEAEDPALGRRVAVKTIQVPLAASKPEREEYEKRFLAEARIAARLSVAVGRGLLLDVLATGDDEEVDAAMRYFLDMLYAHPPVQPGNAGEPAT